MTTLANIRRKFRLLTASPSASQITDGQIDTYINNFYLYNLPAHLKLWNLHGSYSLTLNPHRWGYAFPVNTYTNFEPPFYVDGYEVQLFQSPAEFYRYAPSVHTLGTLATGTGIAGPYTGTMLNTPITLGTVDITVTDGAGNSLVANDTVGVYPAGTLTGNVVGAPTINYVTGAIAGLTWNAAIPAGNVMHAHYLAWPESRPTALLIDADTIGFYPVPDIAYEFSCAANKVPTALAAGATPPLLNEWWELLAYGAAMKRFEDNLDMESYQKVEGFFNKALSLVERRTLKQLSTQRARTIFSNYEQSSYGDYYPYH